FVPAGYPFSLDASKSSDPDGDPVGFEWYLKAGSQELVLFAAAFPVVHFTLPPGAGSYTFEVHAADDYYVTRSNVTIFVIDVSQSGPQVSVVSSFDGDNQPANARPILHSIHGGTSVNEHQSISWTVTAADPDPTNPQYPAIANPAFGIPGASSVATPTSVLKYRWTAQTSAGSVVPLENAELEIATLRAGDVKSDTVVQVTVVVSDSLGLSARATFSVTIRDVTRPPVARIQQPADPLSPGAQSVLLDGRASSDADADSSDGPLRYSWEQITGPAVILRNTTSAMAQFDVPQGLSSGQLTFRLTVLDDFDVSNPALVTYAIRSRSSGVLVPLFGSGVASSPLNGDLATALALTVLPGAAASTTPLQVRFRASGERGEFKENPPALDEVFYPGQQRGYFADLIDQKLFQGTPPAQRFLSTALQAVVSGEVTLRGFFLLYSRSPRDFGNMDGVTSDFKLAKKLILPGVRYGRSQSEVTRQTRVFLQNPGSSTAAITVTLTYPGANGVVRHVSPLIELQAGAAIVAPIDELFPVLKSLPQPVDLHSGAHVVIEAASEVSAMQAFQNASDSIAAVKAIVPAGSGQESNLTEKRMIAPFITVSHPSLEVPDRFDSTVTLYNADPTNEAFVTVRAYSPAGLQLFAQNEKQLTVKPASQLVLPVLDNGGNGGLFAAGLFDAVSDPRNGYLEILAQKRTGFGAPYGSLDIQGFTSIRFPGRNETAIPLAEAGLLEAYFLHVAHNPGRGDFRTALAILNASREDTSVVVEVFAPNDAATPQDRALLGVPSLTGRHHLPAGAQLNRFIDQLVSGLDNLEGGFIRVRSENPAAKLMTFCTYFLIDNASPGLRVHSMASIDAVTK
ncbi:MAG: PKD domain-containing protein, partial [Acidobacteriota bacterium]